MIYFVGIVVLVLWLIVMVVLMPHAEKLQKRRNVRLSNKFVGDCLTRDRLKK